MIKKPCDSLDPFQSLLILGGRHYVRVMTAYNLMDVIAVHMMHQSTGGFIRFINAPAPAADQDHGPFLGTYVYLFFSVTLAAVIGLQPASQIKQPARQLREVDRRCYYNVVAVLDITIYILHFILNGTSRFFPTVSAIHTRRYIAPVGSYDPILAFQGFCQPFDQACGVSRDSRRAIEDKCFQAPAPFK